MPKNRYGAEQIKDKISNNIINQMKKKRYYTLFEGDKLFIDVIDDMHSTAIWGHGGKLWTSKKKALACKRNYKSYDYHLRVVEVKLQEGGKDE